MKSRFFGEFAVGFAIFTVNLFLPVSGMAGEAGIKDMGIVPSDFTVIDTVWFAIPFDSKPVVICSIEDSAFGEGQVLVLHVTTDHFEVYVSTIDSTHLWLHWIALDIGTFGISLKEGNTPSTILLSQNRPNPTSSATTIKYNIPKQGRASLQVYDQTGRLVKTIFDGELIAGSYTATWNGTNNQGKRVPSGTYFYRLKIGGKTITKKAIVLK